MKNLRREDVFARYGGEEFSIVLPEIDREGAVLVCEKLRTIVAEHEFKFNDDIIPVTISLGIETCTGDSNAADVTEFIAAADAKLYEAKDEGRNRVSA